MASVAAKLTAKQGRAWMRCTTMTIDMRGFQRGAFGRYRWRLVAFRLLVMLGRMILGCNVKVEGLDEGQVD